MKAKIVYNIEDATATTAFESPLEPDVFHIPAGATEIEPPEFNAETHTCSFNGTEWVISEIPELEPEPEPEPIPAMDQLRMQCDHLLSKSDWRMLKDYPYDDQEQWEIYRQALRDLPATADPQLDDQGNLTNVTWPSL